MTITIPSKPTLDALSKIRSVFGNDISASTVSVKVQNNIMRIAAISPQVALSVDVLDDISGNEEFAINPDALKHILTNRKSLDMKLEDNKALVKSGNYKGSLSVFPYTEINVEKPSGKAVTPTADVLSSFNIARKHLALNDIILLDQSQLIRVRISKGKLECGTADKIHAGIFSSSTEDKNDTAFSITYDILKKVLALTSSEEYEMTIDKRTLFIKAEGIRASIRMIQTDSKPFDIIIDLVNKASDSVLARARIPISKLRDFCDNILSIIEERQKLTLEIQKGYVKVSYNTSFGSLEETFKVKTSKENEIHIVPETLRDFMRVMPSGGDAHLSICKNITGSGKNKVLLIQNSDQSFSYITSSVSVNEKKKEPKRKKKE